MVDANGKDGEKYGMFCFFLNRNCTKRKIAQAKKFRVINCTILYNHRSRTIKRNCR